MLLSYRGWRRRIGTWIEPEKCYYYYNYYISLDCTKHTKVTVRFCDTGSDLEDKKKIFEKNPRSTKAIHWHNFKDDQSIDDRWY